VSVRLEPVTAATWRDVAAVDAGSPHVAAPAYYLCLCHYGGVWQPLAVRAGDDVVGFVMWGFDPDDGHHWVGGLSIDRSRQRQGLGRAAVLAAVELLRGQGATGVALSYAPDNTAAARLYAELGFVEDGEADGEVVSRLAL
jgi:diamine N-acetyltransferase